MRHNYVDITAKNETIRKELAKDVMRTINASTTKNLSIMAEKSISHYLKEAFKTIDDEAIADVQGKGVIVQNIANLFGVREVKLSDNYSQGQMGKKTSRAVKAMTAITFGIVAVEAVAIGAMSRAVTVVPKNKKTIIADIQEILAPRRQREDVRLLDDSHDSWLLRSSSRSSSEFSR